MALNRRLITTLEYEGDALIVYDTNSQIIKNIFDPINKLIKKNSEDICIYAINSKSIKKVIYTKFPMTDINRYYDEDTTFELFEYFKSIVNFAVKNKIQSIGLPYFSISFNGYKNGFIYESLLLLSEYIDEIEANGMKIDFDILNVYNIDGNLILGDIETFAEDGLDFNISVTHKCACQINFIDDKNVDDYENDLFDNTSIAYFLNAFSDINESEYYKPKRLKHFQRPFDYILSFIDDHNLSEKKVLNVELTKQRKDQFKKIGYLKKRYIYLLAFLVDFSYTELVEMMLINGSSFSPIDKLDIFMLKYFKEDDQDFIDEYGYREEDTLMDFLEKVYIETGIYLSFSTRNGS